MAKDLGLEQCRPRTAPARLDADGTATPLTEIVGRFPIGKKAFYDNAESLVARPTTGAAIDSDPPPWRWRVGAKLGRTLYYGDILHGLLDSSAIATRIADAMNAADELASTVQRLERLQDDHDHVLAFYRELVADVLHGDFKATVDLSSGKGVGTSAHEVVRALRTVADAARTVVGSAPVTAMSLAPSVTDMRALQEALRALPKETA